MRNEKGEVRGAQLRERVFRILGDVKDPEVPALSVVELGIVRDVEVVGDDVTVVVTPTYSGCPAMKIIEDDVLGALASHGIANARMRTVFTPAWTTDWISEPAREKLRAYGIAPPGKATPSAFVMLERRVSVKCPFCGSSNTTLTSEFSSTACKALHVCQSCRQPFEEFKAI